jgi:hypothetical protein
MGAQAATVVHLGYPASLQIGLDHGPLDWLRYRKQPSRGLLRSSRCCRTNRLCGEFRFVAGQFQEASCLLGDLAEIAQAPAFADDIEEIAVLAGRGICLMFNCT